MVPRTEGSAAVVPTDVVVADLEVTLTARDAASAVDLCRPLASAVGAIVQRVTQVPDEYVEAGRQFEVRLARVENLEAGERVFDGLSRVNRRLLDALGRAEEVLPDHPRRMSGVSFDDSAFLPAGSFVSTVVRMGDVEDPFDTYERLEPEWPEDGPPELDAELVDEFVVLVRALTWQKIVLVGHAVRRDGVDARDDLKRLISGIEHELFVAEPEVDDQGGVRVWAVLGVSDEPADDLLGQAMAALCVTGWELGDEDRHFVLAEWVPPAPPPAGFTRLELRIGPDVVLVDEDGRFSLAE
jgi:hypothetical protein